MRVQYQDKKSHQFTHNKKKVHINVNVTLVSHNFSPCIKLSESLEFSGRCTLFTMGV